MAMLGKPAVVVVGLAALVLLNGMGPGIADEPPAPKVQFPSGRECAARMTVPEGFEVKCFASEPDVVNPIGIDFDHRGRVWVLECLEYPRKAPPGAKTRDRITILEDTDGDGVADKVTRFAEGLNLATGLAVGYGGVFVGEAPDLVFLEDTDGDDKADRRTVLLTGFGYQDTHETLNSFLWGPDGWLYGCHGVFTHSKVQGIPFNACIWRYRPPHPQVGARGGASSPSPPRGGRGEGVRGKFEVFAEGTSNPWGFDYDENGSGFLTACVIPHLFHMVPGGLYIRQAGQNRNPYAFGQIREICDHVHYFGPTPHGGNKDPRSLNRGGGHAHAGCLIYQGGAYPEEWHGRVFMNNIHGSRINTDILKRNGSTYLGSHGPDFLVANDPNFRAIQLRTGPDGSIYLIDWYDPQICHNTNAAIWDRSHGRVYKVVYKGTPPMPPGDLTKRSTDQLVDLLTHKNSWWWRKALLILQERGDRSVAPRLREMVRKSDDYRHSLRALWALANSGAFDEEFGREALAHANAWVRAWAVRLLGQRDARLSGPTLAELMKRAKDDPSPDVRLQLASSCQRLRLHHEPGVTRNLLQALMLRAEDAHDPVIPLMIWIAYEPEVVDHYEEILTWLVRHAPDQPIVRDQIAPRVLRRLAATGEAKHLEAAVAFLARLSSASAIAAGLDGLLEALRGRRLEAPASWAVLQKHVSYFADASAIGRRMERLGIHFGDPEAVAFMEREAQNGKAELRLRVEAVQALALARSPSSVGPLTRLATSDTPMELKREALRALAVFDSEQVPAALLAEWPKLPPGLRTEVVGLLSGRRSWAHALLDAMASGGREPPGKASEGREPPGKASGGCEPPGKASEGRQPPGKASGGRQPPGNQSPTRQDLTENDVRRMLAHKDDALSKKVESVWGKLREQTPQKVEQMLAKFRRQLAELPADRRAGQAVFEKHCMVCHKLNGKGHDVGPDLTGANRRDPEYLLTNILDPNRVVGRDYYSAVVADKSGRVHTGLLAEDTPERVVLKGENAKLTVLPRTEIEELRVEEKSLMPEGLPDTMTEQQFRDLIAYLLEEPFLTRGLIAGPFKMALDTKGPIEQSADPLKAEGVCWKPFRLGPTGVIDMDKLGVLAPPTDSTAYVYLEVESPRALSTSLELAADEDVKVWLNGKEVHRRTRALEPRRVPVELRPGTNRLLIKVHNIYGPSYVWVRLSDPERVLEVKEPTAP